MVDEETSLIGGSQSNLGQRVVSMNIERIRFWGLTGGMLLLFTGLFLSYFGVVFPEKDDSSTFIDKLFHGAPSDFNATQTYIYQLFHFNHTCSVLDFNPSKTISAMVIMFHVIPIDVFVICHYLRITGHSDAKFDGLKKATAIFTPIQFVTTTFFYMVFVNSPDGIFGTPQGSTKFILHYTPYMCWQLGMLLMAIQQCWYIALKGMIPFTFVTPMMMWRYCQFMMVLFVVYTYFCWSFILGSPAWDTSGGFGRVFAQVIMYTWDVVAVLIPAIFAWYEGADGDDVKFIFMELQ